MDEFYFTAEIINGYDFKNNFHNYRHFLIELPITKDDLQAAFEEIGLDITARPGEYYFGTENFELYRIPKADRLFADNENIDELNFLAGMLSNLDSEEYDAFVAVVESYEHTECVADMINLAANIDNYTFISDISDWDEYGRWKLREDGIDIDELGDLVDYIDFDEYGEYRGRNENAQLTDDGVLEKYGGFYERYNGDLNTIPDEYVITTQAISKIELEEATELAILTDNYLREHHTDYNRMYSEAEAIQETITNNILIGKTHQIKNLFEEVGLTKKDTPFKEFSEYEKKYPKKVFMVYQLKENSDKYGLVYSAPIQKDTTLDKIYEDFSKKISFDFVGHTIGISDIVVFSDEKGQRSFYLGEDGWKKIDTFTHEREVERMDDNEIVALPVKPSIKKDLQLNNNEGIISTGKDSTNIIIKTEAKISVKDQINQAKKEQGERNGTKPSSHKPPEI